MNLNSLISWLRFNNGVTDDFVKKNQWQVFGNPSVGTANAINGNALQLDGQSYLKLSSVELGDADFEIDGWVYVDSSSPDYARLITIVNPSNGYNLVSVRKSPTDSTKLDFWANSTADVSKNSGYTYTSDTVSIGQRVHFKLIYQYTTSTRYIKLCVNDKTVAYISSAIAYNRQKFDIYIGSNPSGTQGLIGSIDEVTIYDGTWFSHNKGNVPTADYYDYGELSFSADTVKKVLNPPLTWRYENYGSADLLTQAGTTLTNLPATQSKTSSAFYQPTKSKCFDIPATKEIWIKCDIYTTANYSGSDRIRIYDINSNNQANGWSTSSSATSNYLLWHNDTSESGSSSLAKNKLRPFLLHMVSDATNGIVEYFFASGDTQKFTGNVNDGNDFNNVYIQMDGSNILVSNLIISNSPLELTDDVAQLRQKTVEFTADTLRLIGNTAEIYFDTSRNIVKPIEIICPTARNIVKPINLSFDTQRKVHRAIDLNFDTLREIQFDNSQAEEIYFDTKRNIVKSTEILADTLRNVKAVWRIENYGIAELTTNSDAETLEVGHIKSRTGYAYRYGAFAYYKIPSTDEVWIKLDVYFDSEVLIGNPDFKNIKVGAFDRNQKLYCQAVFVGSTDAHQSYNLINVNLPYNKDFRNTDYIGNADFENPFEYNLLYRLLVHIKSDSDEGIVEYWMDNGKHLSYVGNVFNGEEFAEVVTSILQFSDYSPLISNVIISNAPIGLTEDVSSHIGGEVEGLFETVRKVLNPPLTWTYENYGTKDLILTEGRNYENLDITQSRTGSAFTTLEKAKTFQTNPTYEIWAKFDFYVENIKSWYIPDESDGINWGLKFLNIGPDNEEYNSEITAGIAISSSGSSPSYRIDLIDDNARLVGFEYGSLEELHDLNSCLLYMKSGATDGVVKLWINGDLKSYHIGNVNNGDSFDSISLYSMYDFREVPSTSSTVAYFQAATLFSNVIISNSELPISRNLDLSFDTDRRPVCKTKLYFDTERRITYAGIWRYENYGTADLLEVDGRTVTVGKLASIYQTAFISTVRRNYFDIDTGKELWIKFDFYFTQKYETLFFGSLDNEKFNQARLNCIGESSGNHKIIFAQSENVSSDTTHQFNARQLYRAVLHLKSDSENGLIEFFCSDGYNLTYSGNVNDGNDFENVYIQASNYNNISTYPYVSNVIVSNGEVGINENAKVPFVGGYDICRSICQPFREFFDTKINFVKPQIFYADLVKKLNYSMGLDNDTCRNVQHSVQVDFDIASSIPHNLIVMPIPVMDFSESQNTDDTDNKFLARKKNSLLADSPAIIVTPSTDNITTGTQSVELNLYAQQLTDQLSYSSVNPAAIMEAVHGQYLDYVFNVRVEKSSKRGAVYSFKCCSDIDEILYRQLDYQIPEDEQWHKGGEILVDSEEGIYESVAPMCMAGEHITHIAENMGKQPMLFFADFVSTVDVNAGGVTYHDLISSIFGWSSRVPNMLINVFLRGDKMFVVQRGHEPNTIDLTGSKHTVPNVDCELVRTAWGASVWSETETRSRKKFVGDLEFAPDPPPSGSGKEKDTEEHDDYSFDQEGLVTRSEVREGNTRTVTTYEYVTVGNRKYLSREEAYIYEGDELVDTKITKHTYLGQGQMHSTSSDEEGSYLGGSVGASKGNDRRTPYDEYNYKLGGYTYDKDGNKKYIKSYKFGYERYEESRKVYGLPLFDTSFPVYEEEKLIEITNDINWLNRRTKETVSMSIYDYPHLIDFTDKIIFEGNEYFLENNTATTTPRIINRQDVSFVRWY